MLDWIKNIFSFHEKVPVKIIALNMDFFPQRQTEGAAGYDLKYAGTEKLVLKPNNVSMISTGIRIEIPFGYHAKICVRSSIGKKGIIMPNAPGIIDSDYRDEIKVLLLNTTSEDFEIQPKERIAQLLVEKNNTVKWYFVNQLSETSRNLGGFGSTGAL